jgi:hypothetical protein
MCLRASRGRVQSTGAPLRADLVVVPFPGQIPFPGVSRCAEHARIVHSAYDYFSAGVQVLNIAHYSEATFPDCATDRERAATTEVLPLIAEPPCLT